MNPFEFKKIVMADSNTLNEQEFKRFVELLIQRESNFSTERIKANFEILKYTEKIRTLLKTNKNN